MNRRPSGMQMLAAVTTYWLLVNNVKYIQHFEPVYY